MMREFAGAGGGGDAKVDPANVDSAKDSAKVDPAAQLLFGSRQFVGMQQDFIKRMTGYCSGMMGIAAPEQAAAGTKDKDRRFAADAWSDDPRYDLVKRTYL